MLTPRVTQQVGPDIVQAQNWGVSKGGFCEVENLNNWGRARTAQIAIEDFASDPCENR